MLGIPVLPSRDNNLGGPNHSIADSISAQFFADHGAVRSVGTGHHRDREVPLRIERLANGANRANAVLFQQSEEPTLDE
jgi:hypothetical protein